AESRLVLSLKLHRVAGSERFEEALGSLVQFAYLRCDVGQLAQRRLQLKPRAEHFQRDVRAVLAAEHRLQGGTNDALAVRSFPFQQEEFLAGSVGRRAVPEPLLQERDSFGLALQVPLKERSPAWAIGLGIKRVGQARRRKPAWGVRQENVVLASKKGVQVQ